MDVIFSLIMILSVIGGTICCCIYYSNQTSGGGALGLIVGLTGGGFAAGIGTTYAGSSLGALFAGLFAWYWWHQIKDLPATGFGSSDVKDRNRGEFGDGGDGGG